MSSCTAWVGSAFAKSLAPWTMLSISGNDNTNSPHRTFWGMIYDLAPIQVYDILSILSVSSLWYRRNPIIHLLQITNTYSLMIL